MFTAQKRDAFFPTYVWRFEVESSQAQVINAAVTAKLEELTRDASSLSDGEKWQTDQDLHLHEEFAPLVTCINGSIEEALDFLSVQYDSYAITGCWANISAVNTRHMAHIHPNNYLSGVYYVETGPGSDTITIDDPRPQAAVIRPDVKESTADNAHQMHLKVHPGNIIIFPSWLSHSVGYNKSAGQRISVAFNAMFTNFSDTIAKPQWEGNVRSGDR